MGDNNKLPKTNIIMLVIGFSFILLIFLAVGFFTRKTIIDRAVTAKYVELAINILSEAPNKENADMRLWAVEVLKQYSPVPISPELQKEMVNNKSLPATKGAGKAPSPFPPFMGKGLFGAPPIPKPETPKPPK
jgi:hypothetical protein